MGLYEDFKSGVSKNPTPLDKATTTIENIAPMATTFSTTSNVNKLQAKQVYTKPVGGSAIEQFADFAGKFGGQVAGLVGEAGKALFDSTIRLVEAPISLVGRVIDIPRMNANIERNRIRLENNIKKSADINQAYRDGRISKDDYTNGMREVSFESEELRKATAKDSEEATANLEGSKRDSIDTLVSAATALSLVASGGLSSVAVSGSQTGKAVSGVAAKNIINFFGKKEVSSQIFNAATKIDDIMRVTASALNKVGTFNGRLSGGEILKIAEAAKVQGLSTMSASQIAKKVAIDVLIKKPLIYQTNVDQAINIFTSLAEGDYGDAAKSVGINALFLLSGGPIGASLEMLKKVGGKIKSLSYNGGSIARMMERANTNALSRGAKAAYAKETIDAYRQSKVSGGSLYDALSVHLKGGKADSIIRELERRIDAGDIGSVKLMKVMEDVNMQMAGGNSYKAAERIVDHYNANTGGRLLRELDAERFVDDMVNHAKLREEIVVDAMKNGMTRAEAERIVLGRVGKTEIGLISDYLAKADEPYASVIKTGKIDSQTMQKIQDSRRQMVDNLIDRYSSTAAWANNDVLKDQLYMIAQFSKTTDDMVKQIKKLTSSKLFEGKLSKGMVKKLSEGGYIPTMPKTTKTPYIKFDETDKLIKTAYAGGGLKTPATYFEKSVKPIPFLSHINGALTKFGLGTEPSMELTYKMMKDNFNTLLTTSPILKNSLGKNVGGDDVLSKLYAYVRNMAGTQKIYRPIVDLRQMTQKEIIDALKATPKEARAIMSALNTSMLQVPVSIRGLGDKVMDMYNKIPFASQFSRTQGAVRYTYNPFFRWQQGYQTEFGALLESGGGKKLQIPGLNTVNKILFPKQNAAIDDTITLLERNNIFGQGFSGMGNTGDVFGKLGTHLIASEKRSLAGLVMLQAKNAGYDDIGKFIGDNMDTVTDTMQTLTFSNKVKGLADSPLARTINTVFFPFRFNMKVANLMAKQMSKFNTATQVAIIANAMKAKDFLDSDEGVAWQSQYADAIKFFNWISPTYPLTYIAKIAENVTDPQNASIGDFGLLGGLPFGMITQMLEANGVIPGSIPYMNPSTGDILPKYVPQTMKAEMNLALQSFIGALWSYPGSIMGLPGKGEIIRGGVNTLMGKDDFEAVDQTSRMTPEQIRAQAIIKNAQGVPINNVNASPATLQAPKSVAAPQTGQPIIPAPRTATKARAKKKSQYAPLPLNRI